MHLFRYFFSLGEMVIEYAGELIRSTLTDKRERYYDGRGIGCYMFKIDDNLVVDATMRGNAARFINHSCEVNILINFNHCNKASHCFCQSPEIKSNRFSS